MQPEFQYPKAPITEAIIDIRVSLSASMHLENLKNLHGLVKEQYPKITSHNLAQGHFEIGERVSASAQQHVIGYIFKSSDEKQIFQARLDGFTFSRLAPYESWTSFRDEARRLWSCYRDQVKPENLTRIAVRYVNRIDIPLPMVDLSHYLRTFPEVSSDLPQKLGGLFMQLGIFHPDIECSMLLNEALIDPPTKEVVSIILDIDLFRDTNLPQSDSDVWDLFEVLRIRKNVAFEACITDLTRELFY